MNSCKQIDDNLRRLGKVWKKVPKARLGQLLCTCLNYQQLYYLSDEQILQIVENYYERLTKNNNDKKNI